MATLLAAVADYLRETIEPGIKDVLPRLDSVTTQLTRTGSGVKRVDGANFGRAFEVRHTYEGALAGTHEWYSPLGSDVTTSGATTTGAFNVFGTGSGWPGIADMAGGNAIQRTIKLTQGRGSLPVPLQLLLADKLDASVASILGVLVRSGAKRFGLAGVHTFWKLDAYNTIGTFVSDGTTLTTTLATGSQTVAIATGRIRSFYRGLFVNLFTDSAGAPDQQIGGSAKFAIFSVNYRTQQIKIACVSGSQALTITNTFHVVPRHSSDTTATTAAGTAESTINAPEGLVDWHKATGTLFNATIDLAKYHEFTSTVDTSYSGPLTSTVLNEQVGGITEAYDVDLDTLVTTQGTILAFLENLESTQQLLRYDAQGSATSVKAGFMPFKYIFNGRELRVMTSRNCPKGTVWVLKLKDGNYKKYVPPKWDKTGMRTEYTEEVQFVGQRLGYTTDIIPTGGTHTDVLAMPYIQHLQMAPTNCQAVKLGTFDETIYQG